MRDLEGAMFTTTELARARLSSSRSARQVPRISSAQPWIWGHCYYYRVDRPTYWGNSQKQSRKRQVKSKTSYGINDVHHVNLSVQYQYLLNATRWLVYLSHEDKRKKACQIKHETLNKYVREGNSPVSSREGGSTSRTPNDSPNGHNQRRFPPGIIYHTRSSYHRPKTHQCIQSLLEISRQICTAVAAQGPTRVRQSSMTVSSSPMRPFNPLFSSLRIPTTLHASDEGTPWQLVHFELPPVNAPARPVITRS